MTERRWAQWWSRGRIGGWNRDGARRAAVSRPRVGAVEYHARRMHDPRPDLDHASTDTFEASHIMLEGGFRHLPVLEEGRLVGILACEISCGPRRPNGSCWRRRRSGGDWCRANRVNQELISIGYRLKACECLLDRRDRCPGGADGGKRAGRPR